MCGSLRSRPAPEDTASPRQLTPRRLAELTRMPDLRLRDANLCPYLRPHTDPADDPLPSPDTCHNPSRFTVHSCPKWQVVSRTRTSDACARLDGRELNLSPAAAFPWAISLQAYSPRSSVHHASSGGSVLPCSQWSQDGSHVIPAPATRVRSLESPHAVLLDPFSRHPQSPTGSRPRSTARARAPTRNEDRFESFLPPPGTTWDP